MGRIEGIYEKARGQGSPQRAQGNTEETQATNCTDQHGREKRRNLRGPSLSPVQWSEGAGKHERHHKNTGTKHEHVRGLAQIEAADPADQQVADDEIE